MTTLPSESQLLVPLVDTHCHLDFNVFNNDREEILFTARKNGIVRILNPAVDILSSQAIVKMVQKFEDIFAAVGVHPNDSSCWDEDSLRIIESLAGEKKVVAVGEIGLDYYRDRAPRDLQRRVFLKQLGLARSVGLPVVIHTRQSIPDALDILTDWLVDLKSGNSALATRPGVLHSFSGSEQEANRAIELGFWIGITGPVTFKNAPELQKVVAGLPVERLLIETDAPFMTPHPFRGQRNQPDRVRIIAERIAELQGTSLEKIANITTANAEKLFTWRESG